MSEPGYNDQTLIQYLLGSLSEADAERFDELSLTDDEFADALKIAEEDLVDAYVQGELSPATLPGFESHYLTSGPRREKVAFARALQASAQRHVTDPRPGSTGRGWFAPFNDFFATRSALQWGFAAVVFAILIGGVWFAIDSSRLRQRVSQTESARDEIQRREERLQKELEEQRAAKARVEQELAQLRAEREQGLKSPKGTSEAMPTSGAATVFSFVLSPVMRGVSQLPTISIPANISRLAVQLNLEPNDYISYRVAVIDQSNHQTLWRSGNLKAIERDGVKALAVSFPAGLLKSQSYTLRVFGIATTGKPETMSDYPFKVMK